MPCAPYPIFKMMFSDVTSHCRLASHGSCNTVHVVACSLFLSSASVWTSGAGDPAASAPTDTLPLAVVTP